MSRVPTLEFALPGPADTDALGEALARAVRQAAVVTLRGELGAGKSSLARAWLRARGVAGPIRSPTYSLVERYRLDDGGEAIHLDLYRVAEAAELDFLGLDEPALASALWLVEWPERGGARLPAADLDIALRVDGAGRHATLRQMASEPPAWWATLSKMAGCSASV
jgi:tRNA threonylcarbamoyl adenosine modification protein YjeE